jgi:hypothetical protein
VALIKHKFKFSSTKRERKDLSPPDAIFTYSQGRHYRGGGRGGGGGGGGGLKCDSTHSALASLLWPCIQLISFIASRSQRGNLESFNTLKHLKTLKHMKSCQVVYEN